ncbi:MULTISPECIES: response regulator transcription factor [unclassified Microcella]|uniref:response regulator transcription factor n=1 Tax=unclassified Microcella TaxID=2630066 RepID=UPI0006FA3CD7|nr:MULTISPECIES: response regulator [unclassified Microcella]KQV25854.1 hypothetical protein ASC54_02440 [Yonghaparkia sp. Root332]KRF33337.1 hypothetical protein ASG83_05190 [Yonghaparkia sp. Soil809]
MARILVCEDETDLLALITRRLVRAGHEVITAMNGEDGYRLALEESPDVIVLDWMMPGLTGLEVCRALRAHPAASTSRLLMLTARAQETDMAAAFDAGIDEYVIKPFRPDELQERIAALLERS